MLPDPLFDPRLCAEAIVSAVGKPTREIWVGRSTFQMAIAQALAPGFADRQASSFRENQLGDPIGDKPGNLEKPVSGPARIDGDGIDRAISNRREFFTSRQCDLLKVGIGGSIAGIGALAGFGLSRLLAGRPHAK